MDHAVHQEQLWEVDTHHWPGHVVEPSPTTADLQSATRNPPTPSSHVSCSFGCPYVLWAFKLACPQSGCRGTLCKAGLYNKTIRRVLDIDLWYLMATEYLECGRCKKKVAGWSRDLAERPAD